MLAALAVQNGMVSVAFDPVMGIRDRASHEDTATMENIENDMQLEFDIIGTNICTHKHHSLSLDFFLQVQTHGPQALHLFHLCTLSMSLIPKVSHIASKHNKCNTPKPQKSAHINDHITCFKNTLKS